MSPSSRVSLQTLLVVSCGVAGYMAGSPADSPLSARQVLKWKSAPREDGRDPQQRKIEDPMLEFSKILREKAERTDLLSIISRIPAAKMPEATAMLRELAEKEKGTTTDTSNWSEMAAWNEIANALYFHWGELDPQAALADAAAFTSKERRGEAVCGVLTAWMRTDPNAAYESVKDNEEFSYRARDMIVRLWTPENVFENADRYPDKRGDLLGWYAIGHIDNPERREAMLEELRSRKSMKERSWVYQLLFRAWGYRNFSEAMTAAGRENIPGVEKQLLNDNLKGPHPGEIFQWTTTNNRLPSGPQWENGYQTWLMASTSEARQWFATESPKWIQSGRNDMVAGFLAADFDYSRESVGTTETAAKRALTNHWRTWNAADPKAAERWLSTATPEVIAELRKGDAP